MRRTGSRDLRIGAADIWPLSLSVRAASARKLSSHSKLCLFRNVDPEALMISDRDCSGGE